MQHRIPAALAASTLAVIAAHTATRRAGRTWGATWDESRQVLPGDDLVPDADSQMTMAVTIDAPPERVWLWLVQMGIDRAGLYTHTWLENGLLRLRVSNADRVHPEWQDLAVGDHLWFIPEDYPTPRYGPRVVAIEPPHHLVCMLGDDSDRPIESWQFILRPCGLGTRLLHRIRSSASRPAGMRAMDALLEPGYFYMSAGMLRGIATRAASEGRELAPVTQPPLATPAGKPLTALVAAASAQGTTREIARTVVAELRAAGIDAIMSDAADVTDVTGYDAVVIGSCIHAHRWLPAAVRMIECHGPVLRERPVWLFSTGMQAIDTGQPWKPHYPEDSDRLTAMTGAREHRIFTGCRSLPEPKALWQVIGKGIVWYAIRRGLAPKGYGMTTGDYRDWDAIRAWARGVAGALRDEATRRAA